MFTLKINTDEDHAETPEAVADRLIAVADALRRMTKRVPDHGVIRGPNGKLDGMWTFRKNDEG